MPSGPMHPLLRRQIKRHLGGPDSLPWEMLDLVQAVNSAYRQADDDREMLERSLDLSSQELVEANKSLAAMLKTAEAGAAEREDCLKQAMAEMESFTAVFFHDLRAPVRNINDFATLLMEEQGGRLGEEGREYLEHVQGHCRRMSLLISDLEAFFRASRAEVLPEDLDLGAMAREIVAEFRAGEPDRAVEVAVEGGLAARGDPELMRLAMSNLLANAWTFTSRAQAPRIEVGAEDVDGARHFCVRDNGAGFDPAYAHKLWQPFERLHPQSEFEGTGVGLAIVRKVVERHGGQVRADSEPGRGAVFSFTLP